MTDGLKDEHREAIIAAIAANDRVERAVLFGSRATGTNTVSSDVDIALFGDRLTLTDQARLAAVLDKFPRAQSVDLLLYDSIQDWTLREHIRRQGIEWYALPPRDESHDPASASGSEWPVVKLGEVSSDEPGSIAVGPFGSRMKSDVYTPSGVPVIRGTNISKDRAWRNEWVYVSDGFADGLPNCNVREGDIVFPHRGSIGEVAIIPGDRARYMLSTSLMKFRPDPEKISPLFLFYYFRSDTGRAEIMRFSSQVGTPGIGQPLTSLRQFRVPIPPREEQERITGILSSIDDKIELNRRMNATLEAMARALFRSWFVDFDPVRTKMEGWDTGLPNDIADLFPDRLVDSELGEMPEGWDVGVLDDAVELLSGGTPRTSVAHYWNGDIPWYTAKDAPPPSDVFVVATDRTITQAGVDNSSTIVLPPRTTVISARGTVGRLACLGRPMAMNQTCYGIRGSGGYQDFFTYWLVRKSVEELRSRTHGTIFDTITRQTFAFVNLPMPPVSVAEAFECAVTPIMERILSNLHQASAFAALRDALLPRMVSGGLRTHDVEPSREERSHV